MLNLFSRSSTAFRQFPPLSCLRRVFPLSQRISSMSIQQRYFANQSRPPFRRPNVPFTWNSRENSKRILNTVLYTSSAIIVVIGVTYAAVPLYRMFCQATGYAGTVRTDRKYLDAEKMRPNRETRRYRVTFNADTSVSLPWRFQPQQPEVYVYPGETALVFYTAENPTPKDIIGISSYNIVPMKAGAYFNKIQCFCFEEQLLKAGEQVDMPVFFYLDPEIAEDPLMADVREITLSYTFFPAIQGSSSWITANPSHQPDNSSLSPLPADPKTETVTASI